MIDTIENERKYQEILALIEKSLTKATEIGGLSLLPASEQQRLSELSILAEQYEDNVLKIMPL